MLWNKRPPQRGGGASFSHNNNVSGRVLQGEKKRRLLKDIDKRGRERPWKEKKEQAEELAAVYKRLAEREYASGDEIAGEYWEKRGFRVAHCGNHLEFLECKENPEHPKRLEWADFCKNPLCAMCAWRRSRKISWQLIQVIHAAAEREKMRYIFLTLTVESVAKDGLLDMIKDMSAGWRRFSNRKLFKTDVIGWFRGLEITRDNDKVITKRRYKKNPDYYDKRGLAPGDRNPNYGRYHPHYHVLLGVDPGYFKGTGYKSHAEWVDMWAESMRLDYEPVVWVETVKRRRKRRTAPESAAVEVAKYSVKAADYLVDDPEEAAEIVETLDKAIYKRHLIAYGGLFKQIRREMRMDEAEGENADLIHTGEETEVSGCVCPVCSSEMVKTLYEWHYGLRVHYRVEE